MSPYTPDSHFSLGVEEGSGGWDIRVRGGLPRGGHGFVIIKRGVSYLFDQSGVVLRVDRGPVVRLWFSPSRHVDPSES